MLIGQLLNDRYKIKKVIGGGGMANVYLAEDLILDREVAIKALRMEYANDEEFIARFDREAKASTSLSHPNIVNIYDVGEEDQILYMAMEYIDGLTLKEYIQQNHPIDIYEAINIMKQVTSAIAHAHANDLVHRDIKPQNILIDTYGNVKVTDFGIAVGLSATSLTKTNAILGSVHYLSPEQARGGMATKKSDIYSLGIVLFELLTGRLPFSGQTPVSIALKHLQSDIPSVRHFNENIPQSVENIVLRATAKDPFHRFDTVYHLEESLATAFDPDRLHEGKYIPPVEAGEETKAIPIITDHQLSEDANEETIIHYPNEPTKRFAEQEQKGEKGKQNKKSSKKLWFGISAVLFVLIASVVLALFVLPQWLKPNEVEIPDVVGAMYEDAIDQLEELKLETEVEYTHSEDIEVDHVVETDPRPGRMIVEGSKVTLQVSLGKEKVIFSDYVGRDLGQVKRLLLERGFLEENIKIYEKHSDKDNGEIIAQVQPNPDEEVVPSETQVVFEVSIGPEPIELRNLENMSEEEAKKYLEDQDLVMNKVEENSESVDEGHVIKHNPEAGVSLEKGDIVEVYISIGPEEKPPISIFNTFTVPYTLGDSEEDDESNEDTDEENGTNETNELEEQLIQIYVQDMNHEITEVYKEDYITEDTEYTITLVIAPGQSATYKVVRDGEVYTEKTRNYEEGE